MVVALSPIVLFSLWGFQGELIEAIATAATHRFHGLEVNLHHPAIRRLDPAVVLDRLAEADQHLVLELFTGGDYVPELALSPEQHLQDLDQQLIRAAAFQPLRVTVLTGSDQWSWSVQQQFWSQVLERVADAPFPVSFETHRSRSFYSPWVMASYLEAFPGLRLTADLSHWCVVAERLMTPALEPIRSMAPRVDHIHARVGHAQGPSVGHPFAPESQAALEAHAACWKLFAQRRSSSSCGPFTITPEFGPDGYLPQLPFTGQPVADLLQINAAMAAWLQTEWRG